MKRIIFGILMVVYMSTTEFSVNAQASPDDEGTYVKQNLACTNFKILGVSTKYYAKCVTSVNYDDPIKTLGTLTMDATKFYDNGKGYDLAANDGILTSDELFTYMDGEAIVPVGEYRPLKDDYIVYDPTFSHLDKIGSTGRIKLLVECGFTWKKCSEWPVEIQHICRQLSWPFNGGLVMHCALKVVWELLSI